MCRFLSDVDGVTRRCSELAVSLVRCWMKRDRNEMAQATKKAMVGKVVRGQHVRLRMDK